MIEYADLLKGLAPNVAEKLAAYSPEQKKVITDSALKLASIKARMLVGEVSDEDRLRARAIEKTFAAIVAMEAAAEGNALLDRLANAALTILTRYTV